ncbi:MAG TPA: NADH-quinone oxidoreductase subunit J, partial [Terriglobales bacterium]
MLHLILFSVFAVIAVAGALNLLIQRHPISSALSLIVVMGSLAVEYLLLGAEFVAAIQVIIYAGAIIVLFLFTMMLLDVRGGMMAHQFQSQTGVAAPVAILILVCLLGTAFGALNIAGVPAKNL